MGSRRLGHNWTNSLSLFTFMHWRGTWQPIPVFLPVESQGREPGGPPSMGSHRVGHEWHTWLSSSSSSSRRLGSTVPTGLYKLYFNFKLLIYLAKIFPFKLVYGQGKKITEQKSMRLTLKGIHVLPSHFLSQRPSQLTLELCLGITYTLLNIIIFFVNKWCHTLSNFIGCLFQIT